MEGKKRENEYTKTKPRSLSQSILLHLILDQLQHDLTALVLRMLHADLDRVTRRRHRSAISAATARVEISGTSHATCGDNIVGAVTRHQAAVIETDDIATGNDLPQATVHGVADLDKVLVKEDEEFAIQACCVGAAHELHDHAARDVAVLVDVDGALTVRDQKLAVAEAEHAQRTEIFDSVGDAGQVHLRFGRVGSQVRDGPWLFLVEGQDFDTTLG